MKMRQNRQKFKDVMKSTPRFERLRCEKTDRISRMLAGAAVIGLTFLGTMPSFAGDWIQKSGKWYYYTSPMTPLENSWLDEDGSLYYIGENGEMKTGYFKDPDTGKNLYFGSDGLVKHNSFTDDGKDYIGDDGTKLTNFDDYRKKAKAELDKMVKDFQSDRTEYERETGNKQEADLEFALFDLNRDGYRDLLVSDGRMPARFHAISLWDPQEREFHIVSESDFFSAKMSALYRDESGKTRLVFSDSAWELTYYELPDSGSHFDYETGFNTSVDEYGSIVYLLNGSETDSGNFYASMQQMESLRGTLLQLDLHPYTSLEEDAAVNAAPTGHEADLWNMTDTD